VTEVEHLRRAGAPVTPGPSIDAPDVTYSRSGLTVHRWGRPDGPPLLLLHGLTDAGTAWPDAVRRWRSTYRVIAPDLRGHGGSPRFADAELTRCHELWLADVLDLLPAAGPSPVIIAHSLGGLLALRAAVAAPSRVRGLVLEDPAVPTGDPVPDPDFVADQERFLDSFADGGAAERARMRSESPWTDDEIDAWAAGKPLVDRRMIRDGLTLGDAGWESLFNRLAAPTLLMLPVGSPMAPDEAAVTNPLVRFQWRPGVGHCVRRDDPAAYHAVVDPFLATVTAE
jgi:pimeloyl-ACP methyl ester carboxylesterase